MNPKNTALFFRKKDGVLCLKALMKLLLLETVFKLLGTQNIPGSPKELEILCIRISELVEDREKKFQGCSKIRSTFF